MNSDFKDLTRQYTAEQLKQLPSEDQLRDFTIDQLESKIKELISINIGSFSQLLELEGITAPNHKFLIDYCYSQSGEIINDFSDTLKTYLRNRSIEDVTMVSHTFQQKVIQSTDYRTYDSYKPDRKTLIFASIAHDKVIRLIIIIARPI